MNIQAQPGPVSNWSHVSLDLETLGTRPGCAILSIGAIAFNPSTNTLGPMFYEVVNRASCREIGLHEDQGTLACGADSLNRPVRFLGQPIVSLPRLLEMRWRSSPIT